MQNTNLAIDDVEVLTKVADILLWDGKDRAADAIYALLECQGWEQPDPSAGQWADVFAG